jgi:hypothetical protein
MTIVLLFGAGIISGLIASFLWGKIVKKTIFAKKDYHSWRSVIAIALMILGMVTSKVLGPFLIGFALGLVIQHSHHKYD